VTAWIVADDDVESLLRALDTAGPVAVVDHTRRPPTDLATRLAHAPEDTWLVAFTSGSTASPRGVCRSRASWTASVDTLAVATGTATGTRVLVPGPLTATLFLHAAWHARQVGAQPVRAPVGTQQPWDVAHLVPAQLAQLLARADDLSGRTVVVSGAALPHTLADEARRRGLRVITYYGATELSFVAADSGSGLRPFGRAEVEHRAGLLWVRSPYLAAGYLPDARGRHEVGGALRWDERGWATVGDRGMVAADGIVDVRGRGDDAVQTGGATVHVSDVEHVLRQAPGVHDVAVLGVRHATLGAVVAAAVESPATTPSQLRTWARARLAPSAVPRRWLVSATLPRRSTGKIDRIQVAAMLEARNTPD
jgi:long-chain acyl-CoA synthetase